MKKILTVVFILCAFCAAAAAAVWDTSLVRAEFDGTSVTIHWAPVTATASNYAVYRSGVTLSADANWDALTPLITVTQAVDFFVDAVPSTYNPYYYRIKNYTTALDGVYSKIVTSSPYPESIAKYDGYDSKVILEWAKSSDTAVQYYNVYRSTNSGILDTGMTGKTSDNKLIDYSAANLIKYYYRIQPVSTVEGSFSQAVTVTPFAPPFSPANVTYTVLGTAVTITWVTTSARASYDISGYNIYRSTSPVTEADLQGMTYNGYYYDNGLIPGFRYYYQIKTQDIKLNSSMPYTFSVLAPGPPSVPKNVRVVVNAVEAFISWDTNDTNENVTSYHVYESGTEKGANPYNSFNDTAVLPGNAYLYTIRAENLFGLSGSSAAVAVTIVPAAIRNLTVSKGTIPGTLSLQWLQPDPIENVTGYNIYRATSPGTFDFNSPVVTTLTSYDDTSLIVGQNYFYTVSGFTAIEGVKALTSSAAPVLSAADVSGLTATAFKNYAIFSWNNAGPQYGVTGYNIYKSTSPLPELFSYAGSVTASAGTTSSCYVAGLSTLNQAYYLKVTALNFYGEGNTITAAYIDLTMTAIAAPEKPENVTATSQGNGTIYLSWDAAPAASGVTSYNIYRRPSSGTFNYILPNAVINGTNYTDSVTTTAGTVYYYEIRAFGNGSESLSSTEISGRSFFRPYQVNNPTASYISGSIWLLWSAPDKSGTDDYPVKHYRIYKSTGTVFSDTPLPAGTAVTDEKFVDTDINTGTSVYYYKVKTYDTNGYEDNGTVVLQVNIIPTQQPPPKLVALAGDSKVTLVWRMVTPQYYNIYRRESTDLTYGPPAAYNVSFSLKDYTDTNLYNGTTYVYMIKAVNASGEGPASMEVQAKPYKAVILPADPSVKAGIVNKKLILLTWNDAIGASLTGYFVMRSSDGGGSYSKITLTIQTNYTDTSTQWNKTYYYLIKTLDADGNMDAVYTPVEIVLPLPENKIRVYSNLINLAKGDSLKLRYILTQNGQVKMRVYTLTGAFVTEIVNTVITGSVDAQNPYESMDFYWDGKNKSGQKVASGVYILSLETAVSRVVEKVAVVK